MFTRVFARRSALRAFAKPQLVSHNMRFFSADLTEMREKGIMQLRKTLTDEINFEEDNYANVNDLQEFIDTTGFKIDNGQQGYNIKLTKQQGHMKVDVHFNSKQPAYDEENEEEEEGWKEG